MSKPNILTPKERLRPYAYPEFDLIHTAAIQSPWSHLEAVMAGDISDWGRITEQERKVIAGILRGFTLMEMGIGCYWRDVVAKCFPHPEIINMATTFSHMETIHAKAYDHLEATLGMDTYEEFKLDPVACQKLNGIINNINSTKNLALSLAIASGAAEGVSLFSSFAVLLSFAKRGQFKGMTQILSWSTLDENCVAEGTEVLTPDGWIKVEDYKEGSGQKIAQLDPETQEIEFVVPMNVIRDDSQSFYEIKKNKRVSQTITSEHNIIARSEETGDVVTLKPEDLLKGKAHKKNRYYIPVSGFLKNTKALTALERFTIAVQADGHISKSTKNAVIFNLVRKRKITRLRMILDVLHQRYGFTYTLKPVNNRKEVMYFYIKVPEEYMKYATKNFKDVFSLEYLPKDFITEVLKWDGCLYNESYGKYCNTDQDASNFVRDAGVLSGYCINTGIEITRYGRHKEKICTIHRVNLKRETESLIDPRYSSAEKYQFDEPRNTYCFTVPSGSFLIKENDLVSATGNCHSNMGILLYKKLIQEAPELKPAEEDIEEGFKLIVTNEIAFIEQIFSEGDLETISKAATIDFIKYRANKKLMELGCKPIYKLDNSNRDIRFYFDTLVKGKLMNDFFALSRNGQGYSAKLIQDFKNCVYKEKLLKNVDKPRTDAMEKELGRKAELVG